MDAETPCFIGIDPGKGGCFCLLAKNGSVRFFDFPQDGNLHAYWKKLTSVIYANNVQLCILEKVHAMPKQGVTSMFSFGMNFGIWQGWIIGWEIPYQLIAPQTWAKNLTSKADGVNPKTKVMAAASRMFPHAELYGPKGGPKDGRADALLMAYYGMLQSPQGGIIQTYEADKEMKVGISKKSKRRS